MRLLKVPILLCGAVGLALMFVPPDALGAGFEHAPLHTALVLAGWALPAVIGVLTLVRPPLRPWHASAALAGFAVVAIRAIRSLADAGDLPIAGQLQLGVLVLGLAASIAAVWRPEAAS